MVYGAFRLHSDQGPNPTPRVPADSDVRLIHSVSPVNVNVRLALRLLIINVHTS